MDRLSTDTQQRFDRVIDYIVGQFADGHSSVSKNDEIDDEGTRLGTEAIRTLVSIRSGGIEIGRDHPAVDALDPFSSVWLAGFEMAGANDLVTGDETVADILGEYVETGDTTRARVAAQTI